MFPLSASLSLLGPPFSLHTSHPRLVVFTFRAHSLYRRSLFAYLHLMNKVGNRSSFVFPTNLFDCPHFINKS
jgi:hypothetical protein